MKQKYEKQINLSKYNNHNYICYFINIPIRAIYVSEFKSFCLKGLLLCRQVTDRRQGMQCYRGEVEQVGVCGSGPYHKRSGWQKQRLTLLPICALFELLIKIHKIKFSSPDSTSHAATACAVQLQECEMYVLTYYNYALHNVP